MCVSYICQVSASWSKIYMLAAVVFWSLNISSVSFSVTWIYFFWRSVTWIWDLVFGFGWIPIYFGSSFVFGLYCPNKNILTRNPMRYSEPFSIWGSFTELITLFFLSFFFVLFWIFFFFFWVWKTFRNTCKRLNALFEVKLYS